MKHNHAIKIGILFLFFTTVTSGQKVYLDVLGGYGFPLASQSITTTDGSSSSEDKLVKGTFGKGMNLGLNIGYKFTDQIGIEIGGSYFKSSTIKSHDENNNNGYYYMSDYKFNSSIIRFNPALRITTTHQHLNAYAKIGFVMGVNAKLTVESEAEQSSPPFNSSSYEQTTEYSGRISTGYSGTLGILYNAGNNFSIFIESNGIAQTWAPEKSEITEYKEGGIDRLSTLDVSDRETEYVDKVDDNAITSPNEPGKSLKYYLPFSALYVNVGLQFRFGGTSKKTDAADVPKK